MNKIKTNSFGLMLGVLSIFSVFIISCKEDNPIPVTVIHVKTAGTLSAFIGETRKYEITNLTLTGNLNGTDIRYIREMAGYKWNENEISGKLAVLDLSEANIVSGGSSYFSNLEKDFYTADNVIGSLFFLNCPELKHFEIPNSVTSIESYAFASCRNLTEVVIGNNVTLIKSFAFRGCTSLTEITLPNRVESIAEFAFNDCSSLQSVVMGNSIRGIGRGGVEGCTSLKSVTMSESLVFIGIGAFAGCTSLTEITLPSRVTRIEGSAFYNCTGLTEIHSKNTTPPDLSSSCFYGVDKTKCILYVPKGSYSYWMASYWSEFDNIIETDFTSLSTIN